jgi:hypothetical protein
VHPRQRPRSVVVAGDALQHERLRGGGGGGGCGRGACVRACVRAVAGQGGPPEQAAGALPLASQPASQPARQAGRQLPAAPRRTSALGGL